MIYIIVYIYIYIHTYTCINSFFTKGLYCIDFAGDWGSLLGEKASYIQECFFHSANDRMVVSQRNELRQKIVGRLRTWACWAGHVAFWSAPLHGVCFALVLDKFGCELYCCLLCKHSLRNLMQCNCELPTTVTNSWKIARRFLELAGHCLKVEWWNCFFLVLKWRYRIEILECTWPCYERSVDLELLNHIRSTSYHLFENMKAWFRMILLQKS